MRPDQKLKKFKQHEPGWNLIQKFVLGELAFYWPLTPGSVQVMAGGNKPHHFHISIAAHLKPKGHKYVLCLPVSFSHRSPFDEWTFERMPEFTAELVWLCRNPHSFSWCLHSDHRLQQLPWPLLGGKRWIISHFTSLGWERSFMLQTFIYQTKWLRQQVLLWKPKVSLHDNNALVKGINIIKKTSVLYTSVTNNQTGSEGWTWSSLMSSNMAFTK